MGGVDGAPNEDRFGIDRAFEDQFAVDRESTEGRFGFATVSSRIGLESIGSRTGINLESIGSSRLGLGSIEDQMRIDLNSFRGP